MSLFFQYDEIKMTCNARLAVHLASTYQKEACNATMLIEAHANLQVLSSVISCMRRFSQPWLIIMMASKKVLHTLVAICNAAAILLNRKIKK
jgi:hypothetical protein